MSEQFIFPAGKKIQGLSGNKWLCGGEKWARKKNKKKFGKGIDKSGKQVYIEQA